MTVEDKVGELRPGQLLHTYGVGATVELPHLTVMVLGLENWPIERAELVSEPRLLAAARAALGPRVQQLRLPPPETEISSERVPGVPVGVFPTWLRCPICGLLGRAKDGLFDLEKGYRPDDARYVHSICAKSTSKRKPTAMAARYMVACDHRHLDDFPWVEYLHEGSRCNGTLRLSEFGIGGGPADVQVSCSCGKSRRLSSAFGEKARDALPPHCRGRHPHIGRTEDCKLPVSTVLLGATNSWFSVQLSALSIPVGDAPLDQAVNDASALLEPVTSVEMLDLMLFARAADLTAIKRHVEESGAAAVLAAIERHRSNSVEEPQDLLPPEWAVLSADADQQDPDSELTLRSVDVPPSFTGLIERVVLVERLREVSALAGFTRLASLEGRAAYGQGSRVAPISAGAPSWLPCAEVRGEGVFVQLPEAQVQVWEERYRASPQWKQLVSGQVAWCEARGLDPDEVEPIEPRYVLLHSLSHALIRELALECGYNAASIRERLYARADDGMAGVLLYTAAADSEGTLGGLVSLGDPKEFGPLLRNALDRLIICSSDPTCSEHSPALDGTGHNAACHACQFAAETSCERGNRLLDRAVLAQTMATRGDQSVAYFG